MSDRILPANWWAWDNLPFTDILESTKRAVGWKANAERLLPLTSCHDVWVTGATGSGKSAVVLLTLIGMDSPALFIAPTLELNEQHHDFLVKITGGTEYGIVLNGSVPPSHRRWNHGKLITFSTAEAVASDIRNGRLSLSQFSVLVIDEAHRLRGDADCVALLREAERYNIRFIGVSVPESLSTVPIELPRCLTFHLKHTTFHTVIGCCVAPLTAPLADCLNRCERMLMGMLRELGPMVGLRARYAFLSRRDIEELIHRAEAMPPTLGRRALSLLAKYQKALYLWHCLVNEGYDAYRSFVKVKLVQDSTYAARSLRRSVEFGELTAAVAYAARHDGEHPLLRMLTTVATSLKHAGKTAVCFIGSRHAGPSVVAAMHTSGYRCKLALGGAGRARKENRLTAASFNKGHLTAVAATTVYEEGVALAPKRRPNGSAGVGAVVNFSRPMNHMARRQRQGRTSREEPGICLDIVLDHPFAWASYFASFRRQHRKRRAPTEENLFGWPAVPARTTRRYHRRLKSGEPVRQLTLVFRPF